jgi:hypothetical protein
VVAAEQLRLSRDLYHAKYEAEIDHLKCNKLAHAPPTTATARGGDKCTYEGFFCRPQIHVDMIHKLFNLEQMQNMRFYRAKSTPIVVEANWFGDRL